MNSVTPQSLLELLDDAQCDTYLTRLTQGIATASATLVADRPEPLLWAQRYHTPFFRAMAASEAPASVVVRRVRVGQPTAEPKAVLASPQLWGGTGLLWTSKDGRVRLIAEQRTGVLYLGTPGRIYMALPDMTPLVTKLPARVVREILVRQLLNEGYAQLHAAAVSVGGAGLLLVGDKGAGKTSLLIDFMCDVHADLCANDRVLVSPALPVRCMGLPTSIPVDLRRVAAMSELRRFIDADARRTLCLDSDRHTRGDGKIHFSPHELAAALGVGICTEADVCAVVVPEFDSAEHEVQIAVPTYEVRRGVLARNTRTHTIELVNLLDPSPGVEPNKAQILAFDNAVLDFLLALPWFHVKFGLQSQGAVRTLLRRLALASNPGGSRC